MLSIEPAKLKNLLGHHLNYSGTPCRVIEILDEGPALVLQDCGEYAAIQSSQYGEARRRVARVFTVPLLNLRRDDINPSLIGLKTLLS